MNRQIRVLRIVSNLGIGGIQKQLLLLLKTINKERFLIDVCAVRRSGELETEFSKYCRVITLNLRGKYNLWDLYKMVRVIRKGHYDIVHIHRMEDIVPLSIIAAATSGVSSKIIHHHFPYRWLSKRKKFIEVFSTKVATLLLCVSRHVSRHSSHALNLDINRCVVMYNGVDNESKFAQTRVENFALQRNIKTVAIVSRIVYFKRITDLLMAYSCLCKRWNNLRCMIVGGGEKKRIDKLQALEKKLKLGKSVVWKGEQKEISDLLSSIDMGVLTSEEEGLGNVLLEYIQAGLPVVATKIPPIEEIIENGRDGFLVRPRDHRGLAREISDILANKAIRKRLSINGRRRAERFRISRTVKKTEELYIRLQTRKEPYMGSKRFEESIDKMESLA